jgi:hypothetical protein
MRVFVYLVYEHPVQAALPSGRHRLADIAFRHRDHHAEELGRSPPGGAGAPV